MLAIVTIKPYNGTLPSHDTTTWEIASDPSFTNIVETISQSTTSKTTLYTNTIPPVGSLYYVRAKRHFSDASVSAWTNAGVVEPEQYASNELLTPVTQAEQPTISIDEDELNDDGSTSFTITTSKLRAVNGSHYATHWLIRTPDHKVKLFQSFQDTTNKTSIAINKTSAGIDQYNRFEIVVSHVTSENFTTNQTKLIVERKNSKYTVVSSLKDITPYNDYEFELELTNPNDPYPLSRLEMRDKSDMLHFSKALDGDTNILIPEEILEDNNTYYIDLIKTTADDVSCYDPSSSSLTAAYDVNDDAVDVSGHGYTLTETNVEYIEDFDLGKKYARLNGTSAFYTLPAGLKSKLFNTTVIETSIAFWMYFHGSSQYDETYREDMFLMSGGSSSSRAKNAVLVKPIYNDVSDSTLNMYFGDVAGVENVSLTTPISDEAVWKHIVLSVILDTTNDVYYLEGYVGGKYIGKQHISAASPTVSNAVLLDYIGKLWSNTTASSGFYGCNLHSLRIYNKLLSLSEVQDDMDNPVERIYAPEAERNRFVLTTSGVYEIFRVDPNYTYRETAEDSGLTLSLAYRPASIDQFMNNGLYIPTTSAGTPTPYMYLNNIPSLTVVDLPSTYLERDINEIGNLVFRVLNDNRVLIYRASGASNVPEFTLYNTEKQELISNYEVATETMVAGLTNAMTYVPEQNAVFYFAVVGGSTVFRKLDLTTFTSTTIANNRPDVTTEYPTLVHIGNNQLFSINGGVAGSAYIYDISNDNWVRAGVVPAKYASLEMESWLRKDGKVASFNLRNGTSDVLLFDPKTYTFMDVVTGLPEDLNLDTTVRLRSGEFLRYSAKTAATAVYRYR